MLRARRWSSASLWVGTYGWGARQCPTTRDARRSETESVAGAWHTAARRRAGLRSFPLPPPSRYYCRAKDRPPTASLAHAPAPSSAAVWLARRASAVCFLPPIVRRLGEAELPAGGCDPDTLAWLNLTGPEMADDLFRRIPGACHAPSFRRLESLLQTRPGL